MTRFLVLLAASTAVTGLRTAIKPSHARCVSPRCCSDVLPPEAANAIPPEKLADAWNREEKATELVDELKGCSLWLIGLGPKKTAVGRVLARRLGKYRCYDLTTLMSSTYQQLAKCEETPSMSEMLASEPLEDIEQLGAAVLQQVQAFARSVFVTWDGGAVSTADYAVMQQGIVVNLVQDKPEDVPLPAEGADETLEKWNAGHSQADVTVKIKPADAADDTAYQVIDTVLEFIKSNPAKSVTWKAQADAKLAAQGD